MGIDEKALVIESRSAKLLAVLHRSATASSRGVVVVVGGPQYRVGSHRQFLLLARFLASRGLPVFRFDHSGIGDSGGDPKGFENLSDDIRAAIDCFFDQDESLTDVVLWGLCDAASAAMIYAPSDTRVSGLVMLNPWVRTESGQAQSILRHYYLKRLLSRAFWQNAISGSYKVKESLGAFFDNLRKARIAQPDKIDNKLFTERMLVGLERFKKPVLFFISGKDLTAAEFVDLTKSSSRWKRILRRQSVAVETIDAANHTFSSEEWRNQVERSTEQWVRKI